MSDELNRNVEELIGKLEIGVELKRLRARVRRLEEALRGVLEVFRVDGTSVHVATQAALERAFVIANAALEDE